MLSRSADANAGNETRSEPPLDDDELLAIVRAERARSIGFDLDPELTSDRQKALNYFKGVMEDVKSLPNRSRATTLDIADAVETVLPDLIEIFTGGDDVIAFTPENPADEAQADQETEYVRHAIFDDNDGFLTIYAMLKDALLTKTGVVKSWWEDRSPIDPETFEGKTAIEVELASQDGEIQDLRLTKGSTYADEEPLYDFDLQREGPDGRVRLQPIPPEDFTVARDTIRLKDATYCAFRTRPRAQELIADGHPRDLIDVLPPYGIAKNELVQIARDTAGEHDMPIGNDGPDRDRRMVEVVEHYIRCLSGDKVELWRVLTGGDEAHLIVKEKVDRIPFSAITPFIVTHRFYGESIADKLMQIQQIRTALLRMALDNGYFALNQRYEVSLPGATEFTLTDLLDNRPGVPVRVATSGTINAIQGAQAPYDYFGALEFMATQGESRTGVVRNAQGLNPDTLHDTATGAAMLMGAAQRRVRMIARIFAETGIKDLFLATHALLRKHASKASVARLRGTWVAVDPTQWAERNDVTVEVGVGAGGKEQRLAMLTQVLELQATIEKTAPGSGLVLPGNVYAAATDAAKAGGLKQGDAYFTDPAKTPPPPPKPDPVEMKAQADAAASQAKNQIDQAKLAADQQQSQAQMQLEMVKLQMQQQSEQADRELKLQELQLKHQRELVQLQADAEHETMRLSTDVRLREQELAQKERQFNEAQALARDTLAQTGELKITELEATTGARIDAAQIKAASEALKMHTELAVQTMESADAHLMAAREHQHEHDMVDHEASVAPKVDQSDGG